MTLRGDRITQLRKKIGMKQSDLAEKLGVARNQVSKYETGGSNPTLESLAQMAELFNTTTDYLLGLSNVPHPGEEPDADADLTYDEIDWLRLYRGRSSADRRRLFTILEAMSDLGKDES